MGVGRLVLEGSRGSGVCGGGLGSCSLLQQNLKIAHMRWYN